MTATLKTETIQVPTIFQVVSEYSFDERDKNLEIEWIDSELTFLTQKLASGASTLQITTIAKLMDLISKLSLRKEFLEEGDLLNVYENITDNPAWRLHKKSQSGFELKD